MPPKLDMPGFQFGGRCAARQGSVAFFTVPDVVFLMNYAFVAPRHALRQIVHFNVTVSA